MKKGTNNWLKRQKIISNQRHNWLNNKWNQMAKNSRLPIQLERSAKKHHPRTCLMSLNKSKPNVTSTMTNCLESVQKFRLLVIQMRKLITSKLWCNRESCQILVIICTRIILVEIKASSKNLLYLCHMEMPVLQVIKCLSKILNLTTKLNRYKIQRESV